VFSKVCRNDQLEDIFIGPEYGSLLIRFSYFPVALPTTSRHPESERLGKSIGVGLPAKSVQSTHRNGQSKVPSGPLFKKTGPLRP